MPPRDPVDYVPERAVHLRDYAPVFRQLSDSVQLGIVKAEDSVAGAQFSEDAPAPFSDR